MYDINREDEDDIRRKDWNFAGWRYEFDESDVDDRIPDHIVDDDEWGCRASRFIYAHGSLEPLIREYWPEEVDWIEKFDWQGEYEVKSGWRRWSSYSSKKPVDGGNGETFTFEIDCSTCREALNAAAMLVASAATALTLLSF